MTKKQVFKIVEKRAHLSKMLHVSKDLNIVDHFYPLAINFATNLQQILFYDSSSSVQKGEPDFFFSPKCYPSKAKKKFFFAKSGPHN